MKQSNDDEQALGRFKAHLDKLNLGLTIEPGETVSILEVTEEQGSVVVDRLRIYNQDGCSFVKSELSQYAYIGPLADCLELVTVTHYA